jgi:hypothetical protein
MSGGTDVPPLDFQVGHSMTLARLLVLEGTPYFAPELRREWLEVPIEVRAGTRHGDLAGHDAGDSRAVWLWDGRCDAVGFVAWWSRESLGDRAPRVVIRGRAEAMDFAWDFRALGAISVDCEPVILSELARYLRRLFHV